MRIQPLRLNSVTRAAVALLVALAIATPASAQFGGLRKKLKPGAGQDEASKGAAAPGADGGMIVLTEEIVGRLITGLKAGEATRNAAAKEDTPYGRFKKAEIAYAEAQPKCEAGRQAWVQKADSKQLDKANALNEKMIAAMSKQDYKLTQIYQDSVSLLQGGPSCIVKKPDQPKDYYDAERAVELRAEKEEVKASGLSGGELAMIKERTTAILGGSVPPDASASEKSAVMARAAELRPLLGFRDEPKVEAAKAEPAPAPAPAPGPPAVDPQTQAAATSMGNCMAKNVQSHQAEIEALGKRAQAAQKAGDQSKLMALADTMQQIQMAGCARH